MSKHKSNLFNRRQLEIFFALTLYANKQLKEKAITWQGIRNILDENLKEHGHESDEIMLSMNGIDEELIKLINKLGYRLMDMLKNLIKHQKEIEDATETKPVEEKKTKKVVKIVVRKKNDA